MNRSKFVRTRAAAAAPFLLVLALVACGSKEEPAKGGPAPAVLSQLTLGAKPEGAIGVVDARKGEAKDAAVVTGRVASVVSGYAAMTLMDLSLPYCGEKGEDGCKTPWDYCCEDRETRAANSLAVETEAACFLPVHVAASRGGEGDLLAAAIDLA